MENSIVSIFSIVKPFNNEPLPLAEWRGSAHMNTSQIAEPAQATTGLPEVSESLMKMRTRILTGFESMARDAGPKGVIMTELVTQLGISTKTLYRCFPNKSQLVTELIRSWSIEQIEHQQRRIQSTMTPR